jgi:hypothetical protein
MPTELVRWAQPSERGGFPEEASRLPATECRNNVAAFD